MYSISFVILKNAINVYKEQKQHTFEIEKDGARNLKNSVKVLKDDGKIDLQEIRSRSRRIRGQEPQGLRQSLSKKHLKMVLYQIIGFQSVPGGQALGIQSV